MGAFALLKKKKYVAIKKYMASIWKLKPCWQEEINNIGSLYCIPSNCMLHNPAPTRYSHATLLQLLHDMIYCRKELIKQYSINP